MKILSDTHTLLWAIRSPDQLSARARRVLEDANVELLVSTVSAFEIATKARLGKLPDADFLVHDFAGFVRRLGATVLDLRLDHALWAGSMPWRHRDPFDRLLAAQAMAEQAALVTSDRAFTELDGLSTIW